MRKMDWFLCVGLLIAGCDDDPSGLSRSQVAGSYSATSFEVTVDGETQDVVAEGGSLEINLLPDGRTNGTLEIPGGEEDGSDMVRGLQGGWHLDGSTVTFTHDADTFLRDMDFTYAEGQLVGMEEFGDIVIELVLAKDN